MRLYQQDLTQLSGTLDLSASESVILYGFFENDIACRLRASAIADKAGYSRQYVTRILSRFETDGMVIRDGSGPQSGYSLNEQMMAEAYARIDVAQRANKPFQMSVITDYVPNESRLMPEQMAQDLKEASESAIKMGDTLNETIFRRYLIDFAWASSRMEGNTYTLLDTQALVEHGIEAEGKSKEEAQMVRNHVSAIEYILKHAREIDITPVEVRGIHSILSHGLLGNPEDEGRTRQLGVAIGRSAYIPAQHPQLLTDGLESICDRAREIKDPYEGSLFLMTEIAYLQPFIDVNKRTARIMANIPLLRAGLCPLSFYGMDDRNYINGLMVFYEIETPSLINQAYDAGYRASVERFKSYHQVLQGNIDAQNDARIALSDTLVKAFVTSVALGRTTPDDSEQFFRMNMDEENSTSRDALFVTAARRLRDLDEMRAIQMGVSPKTYQLYKEACAHYGLLPDTPASKTKSKPGL